jgi:pimeloyl-ACP methyl ester carboxylesterase
MQVEVNGSCLWFDVEGPALVPEGPSMRERPTVVLLHGGPGSFDHSYFKPDFPDSRRWRRSSISICRDTAAPSGAIRRAGASSSAATPSAAFATPLGIGKPVVYGHSLGAMVALVYAARHPGHAGALVLQSAMGQLDLGRIVEGFRRAEGDGVAAIAERVYGGDSRSVTREEWARCWKLFGSSVPGDEERARTVVNVDLNAIGLELMRGFNVLDQLDSIECPTLVCVGELDPVTPVAAAREIADALPEGSARGSKWWREPVTSPGGTPRIAIGHSSPTSFRPHIADGRVLTTAGP